ncbi:hypothetical protein [Streptomyces sp. NBC_01538]|uniref:hypothetical protein n=1 Tax=Streptomyces sp. NBC_01538 TaxID=2903897 RepID=UPI00386607FD
MRPHALTTPEAEPTVNKKKNRRWLASAMGVVLTPLVLLASAGSASADTWCFKDDGASYRTGNTTWAKGQSQAPNTWEDWVWRGPTFRCPTNAPSCAYAWGQQKTTGWSAQIGLKIDVKIPYVGKLAEVTPQYQRSGSTTTSYTYTVNLRPGQFAQPIQVVLRRWTQGTYVGAFRTDGSSCGNGEKRFWWDGNYEFGKWQADLKVNDWGSYNVYG